MSKPLLSVCLITYNHGRFIREALDGIVIQKVNFPWQIVVADDCSTDDTRAVITEYASQYPGLFKLLFQEKNVGAARNWLDLLAAAEGSYIAYMEGDDRWNDPQKLRKQVEFLEANPGYVLSCHDAQVIDEEGNVLEVSKLPASERRDYTAEELRRGAYILSVTMCYRNVIGKFPEVVWKVRSGDTLLTVLLGEHGACKFHHDIIPASYRRHAGGAWSMKKTIEQWRMQANTFEQFSMHFGSKGDTSFKLYYLDLYVKKQLDICRWEKQNGETDAAEKTRSVTLRRVLMMRGIRTWWYVRNRFKRETVPATA